MHCPNCGRANADVMTHCTHCHFDFKNGELTVEERQPFLQAHRDALKIQAIGIGLAVFAHMFFIGHYITWFLGALVHEIGHAAVAILMGMPSFPAIRLDGHAAAVSRPQEFFLLAFFLAVHAYFIYKIRDVKMWPWFFGVLFVVHLICGFSEGPREIVHLYAGQFGELFFAGIFLFRGWTGGFTETPSERPLYAALGWVFVFENIMLAGGLIFSQAARSDYMGNGSFGLTNDLVRVANELSISLQSAAVPLLLMALLTPVFVLLMARSVK